MQVLILGLICGSSVLLTALCLMVIVLAILIARAGIIRRQPRRCGKKSKKYKEGREITVKQVKIFIQTKTLYIATWSGFNDRRQAQMYAT